MLSLRARVDLGVMAIKGYFTFPKDPVSADWAIPVPNCKSLHHLNLKKMRGVKAPWELHWYATCCFEQILDAGSYKRAIVRPLTSYQINHPSKTTKTCWSHDKLKDRSLRDSYTLTSQCWPTSKSLHSSALRWHRIPSRELAKSDGR